MCVCVCVCVCVCECVSFHLLLYLAFVFQSLLLSDGRWMYQPVYLCLFVCVCFSCSLSSIRYVCLCVYLFLFLYLTRNQSFSLPVGILCVCFALALSLFHGCLCAYATRARVCVYEGMSACWRGWGAVKNSPKLCRMYAKGVISVFLLFCLPWSNSLGTSHCDNFYSLISTFLRASMPFQRRILLHNWVTALV